MQKTINLSEFIGTYTIEDAQILVKKIQAKIDECANTETESQPMPEQIKPVNNTVICHPVKRAAPVQIGQRYYWNRNPVGGASGIVTVIKEGGSTRCKGWQVKYPGNFYTNFADEEELMDFIL